MLNGLMEWGRNIVCFSVFSVLIKNLLPGEKYVPYVRLYMGFLMLLVFFTPILKFFDAEKTLYYLTDILGGVLEIKEDAFLASLDENSNYKRQKAEYSDRLEESVADYLTEVLEGQAEWQDYCVERTEVRWEEREEHTDFGAITEITVYLKEKKEGNLEQDFEVIVIEPVLVEVFSEWDKKKETGDKEMEDKEIEDKEIEDKEIEGKKTSQKLTKLLAKCYHLREEDIEIKILE